MEKELKSYTIVLLRADLTGPGHPTHFDRKGLDVKSEGIKSRPCVKSYLSDFFTSDCLTTKSGRFVEFSELQNSARNFSHGLDFIHHESVILAFMDVPLLVLLQWCACCCYSIKSAFTTIQMGTIE